MEFKTPVFLILVPFVLALLILARARQARTAFFFPASALAAGSRRTWRVRFEFIPFLLRCLAVALMLVALAGPRRPLEESKIVLEGVNIMLLLDTSTSMAAEDFKIDGKRQNRLEVTKKVVAEFIGKRKTDRIGLVAFAAQPYTVSPLTTDRAWLGANLERIRFGLMKDGTAIGSAIISGVNRLRSAEGKSKIMILLTDGINNTGKVDPLTAAKTAQSYGIKIYTIGAGTRDLAPYPVADIFGRKAYQNVRVEIDEDTLTKIAEMTGGRYFRATDTESLKNIYGEIDRLEKVKIEETGYRQYDEFFGKVLAVALLALLLELVLGRTVFLRIP